MKKFLIAGIAGTSLALAAVSAANADFRVYNYPFPKKDWHGCAVTTSTVTRGWVTPARWPSAVRLGGGRNGAILASHNVSCATARKLVGRWTKDMPPSLPHGPGQGPASSWTCIAETDSSGTSLFQVDRSAKRGA